MTNFLVVLDFLREVVNDLDVDSGLVRVAVETFANSAQQVFDFLRYSSKQDLVSGISQVPYTHGHTNTADALRFARSEMFVSSRGDRTDATNVLILITDGESDDPDLTISEARRTRAAGIHTVSIGIGTWLNIQELRAMASYPEDNNMFLIDNFETITRITDTIQAIICDNNNECQGKNCNNGVCKDGIGFSWCECYSAFAGRQCELPCDLGGDVIFALDASGSVGEENFQKMVEFTEDVIVSLNIDDGRSGNSGTRVGILTYADNADIQFYLNEYYGTLELLDAMNLRYTYGKTNTAEAIRFIREQMFVENRGDRQTLPNFLVVLTDGRSNDQPATWREARLAREAGIQMLAVGIGQGVDEVELEAIASAPVDLNAINVKDFDALSRVVSALSSALCANNDPCASNPCQNGATCKSGINSFDCGPCPRDFTGRYCERAGSGIIDLVFLLDASGSIKWERFPLIKNFIGLVVEQLDVGQDRARVGLATWSNKAYVQFNLTEYDNRQDIIQALYYVQFLGDKTNTSSALEIARQMMFLPEAGDRYDAPNVVIILTDGNSNIIPEQTIPQAIINRISGQHIAAVAIGPGNDNNRIELEGIVSYPKEDNLFTVLSEADLVNYLESIIRITWNYENACVQNPCQNGGRCLDTFQSFICQCNPGYSGRTCERRCTRMVDVTLILDVSGSVEEEYKLTLAFAVEIVYGLDLQLDRAQIGAVGYSTDIVDFFYLNQYRDKPTIIDALGFYNDRGRTNTQAALRLTWQDIFTTYYGDRTEVPNIAILISDGNSNINPQNTFVEANNMKNRGIEVYTVGIGPSPNYGELTGISSQPETEYFYKLPSSNEVPIVANEILDQICQR